MLNDVLIFAGYLASSALSGLVAVMIFMTIHAVIDRWR